MNRVIIRAMTIDDVVSFRRMHAASWREYYANEAEGISQQWVEEETNAWFLPEQLDKSKEYFNGVLSDLEHQFVRVAVADGELVGFVHVSKHANFNELDGLYVDSAYHGSGLAQKLTKLAFAWLGEDKVIRLEAVRYNKRAIRFYEKLGFETVKGSDHLFRNAIPAITMEKPASHPRAG